MDKIIAEVLKEHKIVRYVETFVEVMEAYKQRLFELNEKPGGQVQLEQRVRQPYINCGWQNESDGCCNHPKNGTPECHNNSCPIKVA